ncbi:unnamed protein product [Amoebophrya sp. A120]|nr:unnamed protein product [Amoebophrya sp. A120]|eukprot:GSA120T00008010001.1
MQSCKYGDVRELCCVTKPELQAFQETARLPVRIAAYALLCIAYRACPAPADLGVYLIGAAIVPFARWLAMDLSPFGENALTKVIFGLLIFQKFMMLFVFMGFLYYPYLDAHRRWRLSALMLALFTKNSSARARCAIDTLDDAETKRLLRFLLGEEEELAPPTTGKMKGKTGGTTLMEQAPTSTTPTTTVNSSSTSALAIVSSCQAQISSAKDVKAFWVLCRILSPTLMQQTMLRYNCGFAVLSMLYLLGCCGLVILQVSTSSTSRSGGTTAGGTGSSTSGTTYEDAATSSSKVYWPVIFEVAYIFVFVTVSLLATIMYGERCNQNFKQLAQACRRLGIEAGVRRTERKRRFISTFSAASGNNVGAPPTLTAVADEEVETELELVQTLAPELAEDLSTHYELLPLRFLYQKADRSLVNALYAYVSFLVSAVLAALIANGHLDFLGSGAWGE